MKDTLTSTKKEISRLVQNSKVLFDTLPDILLIIKDDFIIEHMNEAAISKLGTSRVQCFSNCSATAQRGALDWKDAFRDATAPVFDKLYDRVKSGEETKRVLDTTGQPNYQEMLNAELKVMRDSEMWQTGAQVRKLRPNSDN